MSNLNENDIAIIQGEGVYAPQHEVGDFELIENDSRWKVVISVDPETGNCGWEHVDIMEVPIERLLNEWEYLIAELKYKEVRHSKFKEMYTINEFEIVYQSDIDFKSLYGSTSEKVRKQHASNELSDLNDKIKDLEVSINWIKQYIPFLREVIRSKRP